MNIIEFYENLLESLWIKDLAGEGYLSMTAKQDPEPFFIGKDRLMLPIKAILREGKKENQIIFHPLSENITRGESDVIKALRDVIQIRTRFVLGILVDRMGQVAASPADHKKLGATASKYLSKVTDFDERTYQALVAIIKRVDNSPERRLVSCVLRQGSKTKDDGVLRSAKFNFPIFEELDGDGLEVFGCKMPSKKAKARIKALFEYILGDAEQRETYACGSKNMEAPYLHALLTAYLALAERLNVMVTQHKKLLGEDLTEQLLINTEWAPGLDKFAEYRTAIPPQRGNEGQIKVSDGTKASDTKSTRDALLAAPPAREKATESTKRVVDVPWEDEPIEVERTEEKPRIGDRTLLTSDVEPRSRRDDRGGRGDNGDSSLRAYLDRQRGGGRDDRDGRPRLLGGSGRDDRSGRSSLGRSRDDRGGRRDRGGSSSRRPY